LLVDASRVGGRVQVLDLDAGRRLERVPALGSRLERLAPRRLAPPVARRVLARHGAALRPRTVAHSITSSRSPSSTVWPAPTTTRATVPDRGALSSFCIFIASRTSRRPPASTTS